MSTHLTKLPAACCPPPARKAFTLVEMLVVITIIGILAALGSVAAFKALEAAKRARIKAEITNLESALQSYKQLHNDFPPSALRHDSPVMLAAMKRHLATAFPRCNPETEVWFIPWAKGEFPYDDMGTIKLWNPITNGKRTPGASDGPMSPAQAIVFWLTAISKDPAHPLSAPTEDRQSLFDFDKTRFVKPSPAQPDIQVVAATSSPPLAVVNGQCPVFNPAYYVPQSGAGKPFVYFEAKSYLLHAINASIETSADGKSVMPYLLEPWDTNADGLLNANQNTKEVLTDNSQNLITASFPAFQKLCANPKSFQLISAGLDGDYGASNLSQTSPPAVKFGGNYKVYYKSYPSGFGYSTDGGDDDNLTNFSERALGDAKP